MNETETETEEETTLVEETDVVRAWREARKRNSTPRPAAYRPPPDDRPTVPPGTQKPKVRH